MTGLLGTDPEILYPETDGLPLADNTLQFRLIVTTQGGLDALFRHEQVFVAGDLLWYPVKGSLESAAPDVMVVFDREKGDRRSYKQWEEENIPPQVAFEFVSKNNTIREVEERKFKFYQTHGVEEYYIHDPDKGTLKGWLRQGQELQPIEPMQGWVSPRLGTRFELSGKEMQLYAPNGERFASYCELMEQREQVQQQAEQAHQRAEQERQRAEQERQRAERAETQWEQLSAKLKLLDPEQLRALGIDPDRLA